MSSCRCPECKQIIDAQDRACPHCDADIHAFCDVSRRHAVTGWLVAVGALSIFVILPAQGRSGSKLAHDHLALDMAPHGFTQTLPAPRLSRAAETATTETPEAIKASTTTPLRRTRTHTGSPTRAASQAGGFIVVR